MALTRDTKKAMRWNSTGRSNPLPKVGSGPVYAMSFACLVCRTAHKRHFDGAPCDYPATMKCPICESVSVNVGRHFKAPKKSDLKQWKKVDFLIKNGFVFQTIYEQREDSGYYKVSYPQTLDEAKDFVIKYKSQAVKNAL